MKKQREVTEGRHLSYSFMSCSCPHREPKQLLYLSTAMMENPLEGTEMGVFAAHFEFSLNHRSHPGDHESQTKHTVWDTYGQDSAVNHEPPGLRHKGSLPESQRLTVPAHPLLALHPNRVADLFGSDRNTTQHSCKSLLSPQFPV